MLSSVQVVFNSSSTFKSGLQALAAVVRELRREAARLTGSQA